MWQEISPEQPGEHVACHMGLVKMVARSLTYDHKRVLRSFYDKRMTFSGVDTRETILRKSSNCGTEWKIRLATTPTNVHRTLTIRQVFEHERGKQRSWLPEETFITDFKEQTMDNVHLINLFVVFYKICASNDSTAIRRLCLSGLFLKRLLWLKDNCVKRLKDNCVNQ